MEVSRTLLLRLIALLESETEELKRDLQASRDVAMKWKARCQSCEWHLQHNDTIENFLDVWGNAKNYAKRYNEDMSEYK